VSTLVVVQARMGSTRLPGKVLADLGGRPLLALLLGRLAPLREEATIVVATSDLEADDAVARVAASSGVDCVRGPEHDVVTRFAMALDAHPADEVVRLTADCPLTDPAVVRAAIALRRQLAADYAGNTPIRTFPDGLDVEVFTAGVLRVVAADTVDPADREHVTRFVLQHPERFRLANLRAPEPLAGERWTVDTPADLARLRGLVTGLTDPLAATWIDVLAVAGTTVDPAEIVAQPEVVADVAIEPLEART
jgi:spore coat polysaccharide biosynthesis protein SpsF